MPTAAEIATRFTPGTDSFAGLRQEALDRFVKAGLPKPSSEDWRYTSLAAFQRTPLDLDAPVEQVQVPTFAGIPRVTEFESLESVREYIALGDDPLDLLNAAFLQGRALRISGDAGPLHLVHEAARLATPRTVVILEAGASATLVEQWIGPAGSVAAPVTTVILGEGAKLVHLRLVEGGDYHLAATQIRCGKGSTYEAVSFATGGRASRIRFDVHLETGSTADLHGLVLAGAGSSIDHHTTVDHATPGATSRQEFRGVIGAGARHVYTGKVIVRPDAQKTDSSQQVRNLLLADDAIANARPQLEIFADDVKCAHGATVGTVDDEAMFYLRQRGLPFADARQILVRAFASATLDKIPLEPVRDYVEARVAAFLETVGAA